MKKLTLCAMATFLLLSILPMQLSAVTGVTPVSTTTTTPVESPEVRALSTRLVEIKEMDKSDMKSSEKKALRKEVRSIKRQLKEQASGGVYISIGSLLIVILLLILLL